MNGCKTLQYVKPVPTLRITKVRFALQSRRVMKHPNWRTRGATPTTTEDALVDCPVCAHLNGGTGCADCNDGLVSVKEAKRLRMILDTYTTEKIG